MVDEKPNANTTMFFYLLKDFHEPLWDYCTNHGKLSVVVQVFKIKSYHRLSEASYNKVVEWAGNILSEGNKLKDNFYVAKSMMKPFGLRYSKINMCLNFCMLYCLENTELTKFKTCGLSHYKLMTGEGKTLIAHIKLRYFSVTPRV
jgi:hypothetical protein